METARREFRLRRLTSLLFEALRAGRRARRKLARRGAPLESLEARVLLHGGHSGPEDGIDDAAHDRSVGFRGGCCCPGCAALLKGATTTGTTGTIAAAAPFLLSETFNLSSRPGATKTIYLDFDGHTTTGTDWNWMNAGAPIVTPAFSTDTDAAFSDLELERIQYIWQRVAEDFAPFDVNVTTKDPGAAALTKSGTGDVAWGVRVAIGGAYSDWYGSAAGGVAYIGSFTDDADTPAFVFSKNLSNGEKNVAEAVSHEVGHTLGLSHKGISSPYTEYYAGHGSGATGWAPILGNSYSKQVTQWSRGEYAGASNTQDELAIITGTNGFGYRTDDFGSTLGAASLLSTTPGTGVKNVNQKGVIERTADNDWFRFTTSGGTTSLTFSPAERGANLDIAASLYNSAGVLLTTSSPADSLGATITLTLSSGTYYIKLDGVGVRGVSDGYSDYGSLGQYTVTGTIADGVVGESASISGLVWHDRNGNNVRDAGEEGLAGVRVYLDANSNGAFDTGEVSQLTAADGSYSLLGLAAGTHRVRQVVDPAWRQLTPSTGVHVVTLATGQAVTGTSFRNVQPGSISGRVWNDKDGDGLVDADEGGLAGVRVYLDANNNGLFDSATEVSLLTGADGGYAFTGLNPGDYRVRQVVPTGWNQVGATAPGVLSLASGQAASGIEFRNIQPGTISGRVWHDRDGDGAQDVGEEGLASIRVFLDSNNNGLFDAGETSVLTGAGGAYSFAGLLPGDHLVRQVQTSGWASTAEGDGTRVVTLSAGLSASAIDFGTALPVSISGRVWHDKNGNGIADAGEPSLAGVTVYLDDNNNTQFDAGETSLLSAADGSYRFSGLLPGQYRVRQVIPEGWQQLSTGAGDASLIISSGGSAPLVNFRNVRPPSIGDFGPTATYQLGTSPVSISSTALLSDADTTAFTGGKIAVSILSGVDSKDRLSIRNQGTKPGQIKAKYGLVHYGGVLIGTYAGGSGATPLTINLNASATVAAVQALLRQLTYRTTSLAPATWTRTVQVCLNDGSGGITAVSKEILLTV